jgi:hypothetical protein
MTARRALSGLAASFLFLSIASGGSAQSAKHEAQLKTVRGVVVDKADNPISASVVFLKNVRTNQVKSYIADNQGNYRFSGLDPNSDYELHAEKDGAKSPTRSVSSFDTRMDIVLNLKLASKRG